MQIQEDVPVGGFAIMEFEPESRRKLMFAPELDRNPKIAKRLEVMLRRSRL